MPLPHLRAAWLLAATVLVATSSAAPSSTFAGGTESIRQTTAKDFEEGEATASVILPTGELVPGLRANRVPLDATFVWSAVVAADGRSVFFGTGDQGRIYSVTPRQGTAAPTVRKLADLDTPWVTALALRPDGTLLAGSTPGGRVFAIAQAADGKGTVKPLAKLPAEHVWALAHDASSGLTYAGTGGPGKVFSIDGKGTVKPVWDSGDKQVVSLLLLPGGGFLAGTSAEGVLYRVGLNGVAMALQDFEADEVRAITRVGATTYVAVNDFEGNSTSSSISSDIGSGIGGDGKSSSGSSGGSTGDGKGSGTGSSGSTSSGGSAGTTPTATKGTRITIGGAGAPVAAGGGGRSGSARGKGAVYRLEDSGAIEQVFVLSDGYLTGLLPDRNGEILAAAGTQGKVYRLLPDRTFALAADLSERQALALVRTADGFLVGTGDVGGLYEVRPAASGEASYLSKVFDGEFPSLWGRLRFTGTENLVFETRSGNTSRPDKTWTTWKRLADLAHAGSEGEGRIASPQSRYLQYRVTFSGQGASKADSASTRLQEVSLYYLPQNQRPRITDVYLSDPPAGSGALATRSHSSVLKLRWRVENRDGDTHIYRLSYRQEKETVWRPLGAAEPLTRAELDWNTDSVPDGQYLVRVWGSDERSNSSDRALDATFVSAPFLVDNTRPEVRDLSWKSPVITGRVLDATSVVSAVEYSVDGQEWRPVTPADGVFDQRSEQFVIRPPAGLSKGPHVFNVRAADSADNLGAGRIQVEVK